MSILLSKDRDVRCGTYNGLPMHPVQAGQRLCWERRNIAAELHDDVGQSLAVMRMQLAVAKETYSYPQKNVIPEKYLVSFGSYATPGYC